MKVDIVGFEGRSISLREDNIGVHPENFEWCTVEKGDNDIIFYCDGWIKYKTMRLAAVPGNTGQQSKK